MESAQACTVDLSRYRLLVLSKFFLIPCGEGVVVDESDSGKPEVPSRGESGDNMHIVAVLIIRSAMQWESATKRGLTSVISVPTLNNTQQGRTAKKSMTHTPSFCYSGPRGVCVLILCTAVNVRWSILAYLQYREEACRVSTDQADIACTKHQSTARCSASRTNGELHPIKNHITSEADFVTLCVLSCL